MNRGDLVGYRQKDGSIRAMLFLRTDGQRNYFLCKSKFIDDIAIMVLYKNEVKKMCFVAASSKFGGASILEATDHFFDEMTQVCTAYCKEDANES